MEQASYMRTQSFPKATTKTVYEPTPPSEGSLASNSSHASTGLASPQALNPRERPSLRLLESAPPSRRPHQTRPVSAPLGPSATPREQLVSGRRWNHSRRNRIRSAGLAPHVFANGLDHVVNVTQDLLFRIKPGLLSNPTTQKVLDTLFV
jgi:hypothetical protein